MLMLLLPAKFLFLQPELKQNSKTKVDVYSVGQFFAKPMLQAAILSCPRVLTLLLSHCIPLKMLRQVFQT